MKRLLLPLLAALALPASVNAESVWLVISNTQESKKIEMNDMEQCKEIGEFWAMNANAANGFFASWSCSSGK